MLKCPPVTRSAESLALTGACMVRSPEVVTRTLLALAPLILIGCKAFTCASTPMPLPLTKLKEMALLKLKLPWAAAATLPTLLPDASPKTMLPPALAISSVGVTPAPVVVCVISRPASNVSRLACIAARNAILPPAVFCKLRLPLRVMGASTTISAACVLLPMINSGAVIKLSADFVTTKPVLPSPTPMGLLTASVTVPSTATERGRTLIH